MSETTSVGATPAAAGAMPTQTTPVSPAAGTSPSPATGDPEALGDPGKRALDAMKAERDAAIREARSSKTAFENLQNATATDAEKALKAAKAEGAAEVTERFHGQIRRAEIRTALTSAGINASVLDLAAKADEFASLKVSDDGDVTGLDAAVEAFKRARPDLFVAKAGPRAGDSGLGPRGTPAAGGPDLNTWIRKEAGRT